MKFATPTRTKAVGDIRNRLLHGITVLAGIVLGDGLLLVRSYAESFGWTERTNGNGEVAGRDVWFEVAVASLSPAFSGHATAGAEMQPAGLTERDRQMSLSGPLAAIQAVSRIRLVRPVVAGDIIRFRDRPGAVTARAA
ncbi:hypothetical protein [Kitasatospora sp. NPDC087315]|uniref:hypothetical protein n=1 Tax=Kitasatospora sp. NPDC087315 TaxID=3364069 RepID=UPI00382C3E23